MTFSNAFAFAGFLPRLRGAVAPVRTLSFRRADGSKLVRIKTRRPKARRPASGDANVALIMVVMMSLVFGPVIGMHLIAAFVPATTSQEVVARTSGAALPPG